MVKLKDVADAAGVTIATVSIALSGKGRVSASTRDRIIRLASDMNYRNIDFSMQKEMPKADVGLIIADNQHFVLHDFLNYTETYQLKHQIEHIFNGNPNAVLPSLLTQAKGVLHSGYVGELVRNYLKQHPELPFVSINDETEYSVRTDFTAGVHRAMQYLLALGHRKIAFHEGSNQYAAPRLYNQAIAKCFKEYDVDKDDRFAPCSLGGTNDHEYMEAALKWARPLIHSGNRPTAFFCSGIACARAVIYLAMEAGLRIPEDISVLALGGLKDATSGYPYVTHISEDFQTMTTTALTMLQRLISGLNVPEKNVLVDTKFVVMHTTGKCKGGKDS